MLRRKNNKVVPTKRAFSLSPRSLARAAPKKDSEVDTERNASQQLLINSKESMLENRSSSMEIKMIPRKRSNEDPNMDSQSLIKKYFKIMDDQGPPPDCKRPIEFKILYWMIAVSLAFITLSYWLTATHIDFWTDSRFSLLLVLLRYFPTILLTLTYVLIYFQMQNLFVISRVQSSNSKSSRFTTEKVMRIIKVVTWILMGCFVIIEFLLITGVFILSIKNLTQDVYKIQLVTVSGVILLLCNVMMFVIYYNYAGMPYLSHQHESNLRHHVYVALFWTFAFVIKYCTAFGGWSPDNFQLGKTTDVSMSHSEIVFYSIFYFTLSIVCDILPFIATLDLKFIHIQTFDLIHIYKEK